MTTPWLVNPPKKRRKRSSALKPKRKQNPSRLMLINRGQGRKVMKKKKASPSRSGAPKRRNPVRKRPLPRRRKSYRRNPLVRGRALEQMLLVGAGFLVAPMAANIIPFTPTTRLGEYIKKAAAVTVGGTIATQIFGKRYGNAVLLGGMISVGVDVLRDFVPAFGNGVFGNGGVGGYFPPNAEIEAASALGNGMAATNLLPDPSGVPARWGSRYALSAPGEC